MERRHEGGVWNKKEVKVARPGSCYSEQQGVHERSEET